MREKLPPPGKDLTEYLRSVSDKELVRLLLGFTREKDPETAAKLLATDPAGPLFADPRRARLGDDAVAMMKLVPIVARKTPRRSRLETSGKAKKFFSDLLSALPRERFSAAAADDRMFCSDVADLADGEFSSVTINMRKLAAFAISSGKNVIFVAHNHPDGAPYPSESDDIAVKVIAETLGAMGVVLADSIIVGRGFAISVREMKGDDLFGCPPPARYRVEGRK